MLAIIAASLLAAAPQASANACNYDGRSFNACLRFDWAECGYYRVHVQGELYAKITFYDCYGALRTYNTDIVRRDFRFIGF